MRSVMRGPVPPSFDVSMTSPSPFFFTQGAHARLERVLVRPGVPARGEGGDDLGGHGDLPRARRHLRRHGHDIFRRAHFVREEHGVQDERLFERPNADDVLFRTHHEAANGDARLLPHRLTQKHVRLSGGRTIRARVVAPVPEQRIDLRKRDELLDGDGAVPFGRRRRQLVVRQHDDPILRDLEPLLDVIPGNLVARSLRNATVTNPLSRTLLELVEGDAMGFGRRYQLDRNADEPEGDRARPRRSRHDIT